MTTKQQLQDQLAKLEQSHKDEVAELRAKINSMKDEPQGVWRPEKGGWYWFVNAYGEVKSVTWDNDSEDNDLLAIGNVYRTQQEAEDYARYRRIHQKLKELAGGWEPDWSSEEQHKFCFYGWDYAANQSWKGTAWTKRSLGLIYFPTADARDKAGEAIGAEDLKFYLTYGG